MKNIDLIFTFIKETFERIQFSELKKEFSNISETTLIRNLNKLIVEGKIRKEIEGKNSFYKLFGSEYSVKYLSQPFFEREKKSYNFDFLKNYIPNQTSFLGEGYKEIEEKYDNFDKLSTYDYLRNIRGIENLLIDLSYASSKLEGNTYSYLDTLK